MSKNTIEVDRWGNTFYYKNGKAHREDGPAIEWVDGDIEWAKYGLTHRIGGPARITKNGGTSYWLYDFIYKQDDYNHLISNLPLLYWYRFKEGRWI